MCSGEKNVKGDKEGNDEEVITCGKMCSRNMVLEAETHDMRRLRWNQKEEEREKPTRKSGSKEGEDFDNGSVAAKRTCAI